MDSGGSRFLVKRITLWRVTLPTRQPPLSAGTFRTLSILLIGHSALTDVHVTGTARAQLADEGILGRVGVCRHVTCLIKQCPCLCRSVSLDDLFGMIARGNSLLGKARIDLI